MITLNLHTKKKKKNKNVETMSPDSMSVKRSFALKQFVTIVIAH